MREPAVSVYLTAEDCEDLAVVLRSLGVMRIDSGVHVGEIQVGDDQFKLLWDDAQNEYRIEAIA